MRASTPDTVIIINSVNKKEDEARETVRRFFLDSVVRQPMDDEEDDLVRYMLKHAGVIDVSNDFVQREVSR